MKLYLLENLEGLPDNKNPWNPWYDKSFGFVIRAESEADARKIAARHCGDEGERAWLSDKLSTCTELQPDGEPGIVLQDFMAA